MSTSSNNPPLGYTPTSWPYQVDGKTPVWKNPIFAPHFRAAKVTLNDNASVTLGSVTDLTDSLWLIIVANVDDAINDEIVLARVDDDGDDISILELGILADSGSYTTKWTTTVDTTNGRYMFGSDSGTLTLKNTNGDGLVFTVSRLM